MELPNEPLPVPATLTTEERLHVKEVRRLQLRSKILCCVCIVILAFIGVFIYTATDLPADRWVKSAMAPVQNHFRSSWGNYLTGLLAFLEFSLAIKVVANAAHEGVYFYHFLLMLLGVMMTFGAAVLALGWVMGAGLTLKRMSAVRLLFKSFYVPFMFIVIWELAIRAKFLLKTSMCMRCLVWSWAVAMIALGSVASFTITLKPVQSDGGVLRYSPYDETANGAVRNSGMYGWLTIYGTLLLVLESAFVCVSFYWVGGSTASHRIRSWSTLVLTTCVLAACRASNAFGYARWGFLASAWAELLVFVTVLGLESAITREAFVKAQMREQKLAMGDRSADLDSDDENTPLV